MWRAGPGFGQVLNGRSSAQIDSGRRAEYEQDIGAGRAQLDEATYAAAWAKGRAMTLEQAVAYALEEAG